MNKKVYPNIPKLNRGDIIGHQIVGYFHGGEELKDSDVVYQDLIFQLENARRFSMPYPPWPCNPFGWVAEMPPLAKEGKDRNLLAALMSGRVTALLVYQREDGYIDETPLLVIGDRLCLIHEPACFPGIGGGVVSICACEKLEMEKYSDYWAVDEESFARQDSICQEEAVTDSAP